MHQLGIRPSSSAYSRKSRQNPIAVCRGDDNSQQARFIPWPNTTTFGYAFGHLFPCCARAAHFSEQFIHGPQDNRNEQNAAFRVAVHDRILQTFASGLGSFARVFGRRIVQC